MTMPTEIDVRRRALLKISLLGVAGALAGGLPPAAAAWSGDEPVPDGRPHRFALGRRAFLLDGRPFQIRSGEMHPARIPAEHWRHRIRMARAMGLNTVALYLMWNELEREPGVFDFGSERRDFVRFIRLCAEEGMWVYLRPGPYVCAEWDFGGLPPYLLRKPGVRVRDKDDPDYMAAVERYLAAVAPRIAPLLAAQGGPVLMLQVENEYASFGGDLAYLERLRALWERHGIAGPFSISDGLAQLAARRTYLPGAALGLDGDTDFAAGQRLAGEAPVWAGEGYPGWLTHWGDPDFQRGDYASTLRQLMAQGRSFNLYVVHGGSNFGFGAGANAHGDGSGFEPVITSYDYGAPIDERGAPTPDYHAFRRIIGERLRRRPPMLPAQPPTLRFAPVLPAVHASLWDNLPAPRAVPRPQAMEELFAQDHGMVLYRKRLDAPATGRLKVEGLRDYATVFGDGRYLDYLSRVRKPGLREGDEVALAAGIAELDLLVDSFGHVGYGQDMADRKGIVGEVGLDGAPLRDWLAYSLPLDAAFLAALRPVVSEPARPGLFFKATLPLRDTGDSYLDMRGWTKGYVWVNGHLLGRYWQLGPQRRLFCPAGWLRPGDNEILVFDQHQTRPAPIGGVETLRG